MKKAKKIKMLRNIACLLICIICLCGQECDPATIDALSGVFQGVGAGLFGSSNENMQIAGFATWVVGKTIEIGRSPSTNYNPNLSDSFAKLGYTVTNTLSGNSTAKQPEQHDSVVEKSRSYTNVSPVGYNHFSSYSTSSSITQNINLAQNIAEPQVNNVATSDRVILPGNRDPRRSNHLRNQNRPLTGRDSVSANQNAGNARSRAQAANRRSDYVQNPSQPTSRPPTNQSSITSPKPLPTNLARAAEVNGPNPAPPPETSPVPAPASTANKIAEYTPPKPPQNNPSPPPNPIKTPPAPPPKPEQQPQQEKVNYMARGIDWGNQRAKVSAYFNVGEVFTTGLSVDFRRRDALFSLPLNERDKIIDNILKTAKELDKLREKYGPIRIMSWYRDEATNKSIQGAATDSTHIRGYGVDMLIVGYSRNRLREVEQELEKTWGNGGVGRGAIERGFIHLDLGSLIPETEDKFKYSSRRRWDY